MDSSFNKNTSDIRKSLRNLRILKWMAFGPIGVMAIVGLVLFAGPEEWRAALKPIMLFLIACTVVAMFLGMRIRSYKCPRCGNSYHQAMAKGGLFSLPVFNDFATKCMHCGLKLDGSNV